MVPGPSRLSATAEPQPPSSFIGREDECSRVRKLLSAGLAGSGQLVLIGGEPGVGKTTLAQQATAALDGAPGPPPVLLWGRCWEGDGAPPFWPWSHALRRYVLDHDDVDLAEELGDDAFEITRILPQLRRRFPTLPRRDGPDSEQARFRLFDRFTAFLQLASATQPLVLALDDLHWADVPSLRLLEFVAREIGNAPIVIVATYRDTDLTPAHPLYQSLGALLREPLTTRVLLRGFSPSECKRYAGQVVGAELPAHVGAVLHARTNGNPFFLKEIVHWLLLDNPPAAASDDQLWQRAVPAGLAEVIARRIAPLGPEAVAMLEIAAVIGVEFDATTLASVCLALPAAPAAAALGAHLDRATQLGIIQPDVDRVGHFAFTHALVADTLRARVGAAHRAQLHARIATSLAAAASPNHGHAATLAWHFGAAGRDYTEPARRYARLAGDDAMQRGAFEDAARFYETAANALLPATEAGENERLTLIELLANAWRAAGRLNDAQPLYDEVAQHARKVDDFAQLVRVTLARVHVVGEYGRSDPVICGWLEAASEQLGDRDPLLRSRLLARHAMELWSIDYARALAMAHEAVALAQRCDDPSTLAYAYYCRFGGDLDIDRSAAGARMLAAGLRAGDLELVAEARVQRLRSALEQGDLSSVTSEIVALQDLAAESHSPRHQWLAQVVQASWLITQGSFADAEAVSLRALALGERAQEPNAQQLLAAQIAQLRTHQGRLSEILPLLESITRERAGVAAWNAALAFGYARLGRLDDARAVLAAIADPQACVQRRDNAWLTMMHYLSCAVGETGDRRWAALIYAHLEPHGGRNVVGDVGCYGPTDYGLAKLALVLGDEPAAQRHFESALHLSARLHALPALAETQHAYGTWLMQRGEDAPRAVKLLHAALATAQQVGMADLASSVTALLAASPRDPEEPEERAAPTAQANPCTFRRDGDYWTLTYAGSLTRLRDAKALHHLSMLLREPGREWHVTDFLMRDGVEQPSTGDDLHVSKLDAAPLADARATAAYRQRLADARDQLAEATSNNDLGRQEMLQREIDMLLAELGGRLRLGHHARATGALETTRNTITKALRRQLTKIDQEHPALGRHLLSTVRVGLWCSYRPETPVSWDLGS